MDRLPRWRASLALAALLGGPGCSLAFVNGPPRDHSSRHEVQCSNSQLLPVGDLIGGGLLSYGGLVNRAEKQDQSAAASLTMVGAAVLVSAVYGLATVKDCRQAKAALAMREAVAEQAREAATPVPLVPGAPDPWTNQGPPPNGFWPPAPEAPSPAPPPPPTSPTEERQPAR